MTFLSRAAAVTRLAGSPGAGCADAVDAPQGYLQAKYDAPLVFLCRADCWMSWNAARRAIAAGYTRVFRSRAGTSGWSFRDWPSERLWAYGVP